MVGQRFQSETCIKLKDEDFNRKEIFFSSYSYIICAAFISLCISHNLIHSYITKVLFGLVIDGQLELLMAEHSDCSGFCLLALVKCWCLLKEL